MGREDNAFSAMMKKYQAVLAENSRLHQKFVVIDQRISWYGSINPLSYGDAEESFMRLENPAIAGELLKILGK